LIVYKPLIGGIDNFLMECQMSENLKNYPNINEQLEKIRDANKKFYEKPNEDHALRTEMELL